MSLDFFLLCLMICFDNLLHMALLAHTEPTTSLWNISGDFLVICHVLSKQP